MRFRGLRFAYWCSCCIAVLAVVACEADPCDGIACSGHGHCVARDLSPYCVCDEGFEDVGLTCIAESEVDPCEGEDICPDHRTCVPDGLVGRCECVPGCAGGECELYDRAIICSGSFRMGSPREEAPLRRDEDGDEAQHEVLLTHDFEILVHEITRTVFQERMGFNPSEFERCPNCPVERVTWSQAAAFCNEVSDEDGYAACYICEPPSGDYRFCWFDFDSYDTPYDCPGYRLPTEAEWEYAARAGTPGPTYNNAPFEFEDTMACDDEWLDEIAWYCGNAELRPHPAANLAPNAWGLYDMLGNVSEWCHDFYDGGYDSEPVENPFGPPSADGDMRVFRGGGFYNSRQFLRAAARSAGPLDSAVEDVGFRVVRTLGLEP